MILNGGHREADREKNERKEMAVHLKYIIKESANAFKYTLCIPLECHIHT